MARFRIASTPRFYHKASGEWEDGESLFLTCHVRHELAENVAEHLKQGIRVLVTGHLRQRSYETEEGQKRTVYEVEVEEIGLSLLNADKPNGGQVPVMTELTGMDLIQRELGGRVISELDGGEAPDTIGQDLTGMDLIQRELGGQVIGEIED